MPGQANPLPEANFNPDQLSGSVFYNGVQIDFVRTTKYSTEPVYDDTETDLMYWNAKFTFEGYVYRNSIIANSDGPPPGQNTPSYFVQMRHMLMVPRRQFIYKNNGVVIFNIGKDNQVAKGTIPTNVTATNLLSLGAWFITYEITVPYIECGIPSPPSPNPNQIQNLLSEQDQLISTGNSGTLLTDPAQQPLLNDTFNPIGSLRWKSTHAIDAYGYSTIDYAGRLIMRIPITEASTDDFRQILIPRIPNNFIRGNMKFVVQQDGMACDFSFSDTEQYAMPPIPAWSWKSKFITSITKRGTVVTGMCSVEMKADKNTSKVSLIEAAIGVCFQTLRQRGLATNPTNPKPGQSVSYLISDAEIEDSFDENSVRVFIRGDLRRTGSVQSGFSLNINAYGQPCPLVLAGQNRGIAPPVFGNVPGVTFLAQLFNDPCLNFNWQTPDSNAEIR